MRVNHKSLFSSIQYASPLDGAWTKKQLLSLHVISHLETRLSLGCCVQQAMLKILRQHHNNHKSRIFHRKLHDDMLSTFFTSAVQQNFIVKHGTHSIVTWQFVLIWFTRTMVKIDVGIAKGEKKSTLILVYLISL